MGRTRDDAGERNAGEPTDRAPEAFGRGGLLSHRFVRFACSSLSCTVVDQGVAWLLFAVLQPLMPGMDYLRILAGTIVARVASITLNYNINRRLVFAGGRWSAGDGAVEKDAVGAARGSRDLRPTVPPSLSGSTLARYLVLAACVALLSSVGVYLCRTYLAADERLAKLVVDFCLFFLNYNVQRTWVFGGRASR